MKTSCASRGLMVSILWSLTSLSIAAEEERSAAERGYDAMTGRAFAPAIWPASSYENVWKKWGIEEKPDDYDRAFMERYGLYPAPFDNKAPSPT